MKKNDKIWIVTELFYPELDTTSYILTEIADELYKNYDVNIITGPKYYKKRIDIAEEKKPYSVLRISFKSYSKNKYVRGIKSILLSFLLFLKSIQKVRNNDIIFIPTVPPFLLIFISFITLFKPKTQLILYIHDVFPQNSIISGVFPNISLLRRFTLYVFKFSYSRFTKIITIGNDMKNVISKITGDKVKIINIPNWVETKKYPKIKTSKSINRKIVFAGNIGFLQGHLEIIQLLNDNNITNIHFEFWGDGVKKNEIEVYCNKEKINNITFHGKYNKGEENKIFQNADLALICLKPGMYGLGVPSKTYPILSLGKPILFIGDKGSEIYNLVTESKCGWAFDIIEDRLELINFLLNFDRIQAEDLITKSGICSKLAIDNYDKTLSLKKFAQLVFGSNN